MPHPDMQPNPAINLPEIPLKLRYASPDVQAALGQSVLGSAVSPIENGTFPVEEIGQDGRRRATGVVGAAAAGLNNLGTTGNALAHAGALPGAVAPGVVRVVLLGFQTLGHHHEARLAGLPPHKAVVAAVKTTLTGRPPLEVYGLSDDTVGLGEKDRDGSNANNGDV